MEKYKIDYGENISCYIKLKINKNIEREMRNEKI